MKVVHGGFLKVMLLLSAAGFSTAFPSSHEVEVQSPFLDLRCSAVDPNQFADRNNLGYKVEGIRLFGSEQNGFELTVSRSRGKNKSLPLKPVTVENGEGTLENGAFTVAFDQGEYWTSLTSVDSVTYSGVITLEQDFEFNLNCYDNTAFLEK